MAAKKTAEVMIVNRRTGKALQAAGTDNGQAVVLAVPTGEDTQLWGQVKGTDSVKFVNKASGKVLDVMFGGVDAGTWAQVWEDVEDGESQRWQIVKLTATYKRLQNVHSGKFLDAAEEESEDGTHALIWDETDGAGQQWKFVAPAAKEEARATRTRAKKTAETVKEEPAKKTATKRTTAKKPAAKKASK